MDCRSQLEPLTKGPMFLLFDRDKGGSSIQLKTGFSTHRCNEINVAKVFHHNQTGQFPTWMIEPIIVGR